MRTIKMTVYGADRALMLEPSDVGHEGEHLAAVFRLVSQPDYLDRFTCRAEITTSNGKAWYPMIDREIPIVRAMTIQGRNTIQLVYFDGGGVVAKTRVTEYRIGPSINIGDDALMWVQARVEQLSDSAFAGVAYENDIISFTNINGEVKAEISIPQGGGGEGATVYTHMFFEPEWEHYLTYYQLTIPAATHQRALRASVMEVVRDSNGEFESVLHTSKRYTNGNISLFSGLPFTGQVTIV